MNTSTLISFSVSLATVMCPIVVQSTPIKFGGGTLDQLTLIGNVEGKFYFAEEFTNLSWEDAKIHCESNGMHLATVTSIAQSTLLKNAFSNATFTGWHWIAARDYGSPLQFVWDQNAEVLNPTVINPFNNDGPRLCVNFHPDDADFHSALCTDKNKPLCELAA